MTTHEPNGHTIRSLIFNMSTDLNAIIAAATAAAQKLNSEAQQNAANQVATVTGSANLPAVANANAPALSLEDSVAGMAVDGFLKLKYEGIFVKEDPTPFQEIKVRIRGTEIAPHKAVRFGNPATYKKSYNAQVEARTGKPWAEVVAQCMAADPKCTGDYDSFELPFHLVNDLTSLITPGKVLCPAGVILGYSAAITAAKDVKNFIKNVVLPLGKENLLEGVIKIKKMKNEKGQWGILEFGDLANWKVVDEAEMPPEAEAAAA